MVCDLDEVIALVLHDSRSPVAVMIVPVHQGPDEFVTAAEIVSEDYDQFILQTPHRLCASSEEVAHFIRSLNGDTTLDPPPSESPV